MRHLSIRHSQAIVKPSDSSITTVEVITPAPSANVSLDNDTTPAITAITAAVEQLSSTPVTEVCHNCVELGPVPVTIPGKRWVPVWSLQREDTAMAKSFDELLLDKMKGPTNKPAAKRKRCDFKTKVVTDETYVAELKRLENEAEEKKANKGKKGIKKKKANKKIEFDMDIGEDAEVEDEENEVGVDDNEEEENSEIMEETDEEIVEEDTDKEINLLGDEGYLLELWKTLSPPVKEDDITNKWYSAIYEHKIKYHLYDGNVPEWLIVATILYSRNTESLMLTLNQQETDAFESVESSKRTLLWALSRKHSQEGEPVIPAWTGFNVMSRSDQSKAVTIGFMPAIPAPPTQKNVIEEIINRAVRCPNELELEHVFLEVDQAIYKKVLQVIFNAKERGLHIYNKLIVRMGGFHISMCLLKTIYSRFHDSGIIELHIFMLTW